jgi:tetratricopeptide (TPR) repeat protein
MRCSINLRFLLASLLGFSILAVATHCLHAVQLGRQSAFMLERTRQYKAEERFEPALRGYQVYLQMAPKDVEARAEFGLLLAQRGLSRMAAANLETALRNAPDRNEWRRRLIALYITLRRHGDAREHLRLRLDRGKEADGWMDKLVDRNAASTTAHLLRARYLHLRTKNREPTQYFHRALTCWRLGQQKAAAEAFREARNMGLAPQRLFVLEQADYDELARNLPR